VNLCTLGARVFHGGINDQQRPELAESGPAALDCGPQEPDAKRIAAKHPELLSRRMSGLSLGQPIKLSVAAGGGLTRLIE